MFILSGIILFGSSLAMAARQPVLTAEQYEAQRQLAAEAFKEGIIYPDIYKSWLHHSIHPKKYTQREVNKLTGWKMPDESAFPGPKERWVQWQMLRVMRNYYPLLGATYLMLMCALTDEQLDEFYEDSKVNHSPFREYQSYPAKKPRWQKDWSNLKTGVPHQQQLLPRLLAIEYLQDFRFVLDGTKYNYVHDRQQGMPPALVEQLAQELPWFNTCVQDTLTAAQLNHKYSADALDMSRLLPIVKEQQASWQNVEEQVENKSWEVGDTYIRQYLQQLKFDQNDENLSLLTRLRAQEDLRVLPWQVKEVAQYCVLVHASAQLLQTYDQRYGAEEK